MNDEYIIKLGNIEDYENFIIIKEFQEIIFNDEEDKIIFLNNSTSIDIYAFTTENKTANFLFYFSF